MPSLPIGGYVDTLPLLSMQRLLVRYCLRTPLARVQYMGFPLLVELKEPLTVLV